MTPIKDLPEFLVERHKLGWRARINQLKRELEEADPIPSISPKVAKYGRTTRPYRLSRLASKSPRMHQNPA